MLETPGPLLLDCRGTWCEPAVPVALRGSSGVAHDATESRSATAAHTDRRPKWSKLDTQ